MKNLTILIASLFLMSCETQPEYYAKSPWENITRYSDNITCYRIKVPHGWVVVSTLGRGTATIYVPDEKHEWKI